PRPVPVNLDVNCRIVHRLAELKVAQRANLLHLGHDLFSESAIGCEIRPVYADLDRCGRTKIHNLADDVSSFERHGCAGEYLGKPLPEPLFKIVDTHMRARPQGNQHHRFLWSACPEVYRIDGVVRRLGPDEAQRDRDVVRPGLVCDGIERFVRDYLRPLDTSSRWRAQPELKLSRVYRREDVRAEAAADQQDTGDHDQPVTGNNRPSKS